MVNDNDTVTKKSSTENDSLLGLLEGFQESLIRRFSKPDKGVEPVVFEFTEDKALLHQYHLLREDIFWSNATHLEEKNSDEIYDKISEVLVARRGRQVIGACRLTFREGDEKFLLPMETETFQIRDALPELPLDKERHAVISKFAILEEHRAYDILYGLCKILFDRVIATDTYYVFARAETYALGRNWRLIANSFGAKHTQICNDVDVPENPNVPGVKRYLTYSDLSDLCQHTHPRVPIPRKRELSLIED